MYIYIYITYILDKLSECTTLHNLLRTKNVSFLHTIAFRYLAQFSAL